MKFTGWLILLYSLPGGSPSLRVTVWRRLKKAGAVQLKTSASLLPDTPENFELFQWLAKQITDAKGEATLPDGRTETLLSVPKYDFNWQTTYVFKQPVDLPAGTVLDSVAGFDNSPNNKFNPDPKATVHWGDQTFNEMHIAFIELVLDSKADPEKLLTAAPKMVGDRR